MSVDKSGTWLQKGAGYLHSRGSPSHPGPEPCTGPGADQSVTTGERGQNAPTTIFTTTPWSAGVESQSTPAECHIQLVPMSEGWQLTDPHAGGLSPSGTRTRRIQHLMCWAESIIQVSSPCGTAPGLRLLSSLVFLLTG